MISRRTASDSRTAARIPFPASSAASARAAIPPFLEVYVRCPLAVCQARDPKGIYRRGAAGAAQDVPGVSAPYEPPLLPEVVVDGERDDPAVAARRIVSALEEKGYLPRVPGDETKTGDPL